MRRRALHTPLFVAAIVAVLAATVVAVLATVAHQRSEDRQAQRELEGRVAARLAAAASGSVATVEGVGGLVAAEPDLARGDLRSFARPLLSRDDALAFVAWNPTVPGARRRAYERATGRPIRAAGGGRAPDAALHFPAAMVAPASAERGLLGTDAAAGAVRAQALRRARADGEARVSGPVRLADGSAAAVVAVPVFERVAGGRRLRGFATGAYRLDRLGAVAIGDLPGVTGLRLDDGTRTLLATGERPPGGPGGSQVRVAGRTYAVAVASAGASSLALPVAAGVGGLLLAGLVGSALLLALRRQGRAETERASAEGLHERLLARHESILSAAGEGIVAVDGQGRATLVNPAATRLMGRASDDVLGTRAGALFRRDRSGGPRDYVVQRPDGSLLPVEHTTTPLKEQGVVVGAVIAFRDVTDRRRLEQETRRNLAQARRLAAIDPLTGLANHRAFHEQLAAEVERALRHERSLSLVVMDLDHFKAVNDMHGHQVGDRLLTRVGRLMAREVRPGELLARVGGEEFALILPEADEMDAYQTAERIRERVARAGLGPDRALTLSAGVCGLEQAGGADRLYQLADGALYWAKSRGRDVVFRYSPEVVTALSAEERAERLQREQALVSIRILARAVDAKDSSTRRHSERVADLAAELARRLGWADDRVELLREAGLVHDVGKIGVPDAVLFKTDRLTDGEYEVIKQHAPLGAQIVAEALTTEQTAWVRGHHERWDGGGYPDGLEEDAIPEGARILALADAWDTMIAERHYSVAVTPEDAIAECARCAGSQFWPVAVEALESLVPVAALR